MILTNLDTRTSATQEIDIYRSAKLNIDQYGADAFMHAAMKADAMREHGDAEGFRVWMRIGRNQVLGASSAADKSLHYHQRKQSR